MGSDSAPTKLPRGPAPPLPPPPRPPAPLPRRPAAPAADLGMLLVCLIWGTNFSVVKAALRVMPPLAFTAVRFVISSVLLVAVLRVLKGRAALPGAGPARRRLVWQLVGLGVLGNTLYQIAFTVGLKYSTATNCALILSTMPAVVAVLGELFGIERTTPRMRWGIAVATAGVALVIAAGGVEFSVTTVRGDLLAVLATLLWASYTLGLRRLPRTLPPLEVTTLTTLTGTPGLVLVGIPELLAVSWTALPGVAWGAIAYASVLSLIVAYFIWNASVQRVGSNRTAIYMCVTPLVAAGAAWLILGERLVPLQGLGAGMIIAGVLLTRR
jgi:drug/metabolite transporter (DMT)-like permease